MVNLKEVTTQDLMNELASRKDGRAYIECVVAGLKMQEVAKNSKEKAGRQILDFIEREIEDFVRVYKADYKEDYWEFMQKDDVEGLILENRQLADLIYNYMLNCVE